MTTKKTISPFTAGQLVVHGNLNDLNNNIEAGCWVGTTRGGINYDLSSTEKASLPIGYANRTLSVVAGLPSWEPFYGCRIEKAGFQSVSDATVEAVTSFGTIRGTDLQNFASVAGRLTIPAGLDGYYMIGCEGYWDAGASGLIRNIGIAINDVNIVYNSGRSVGTDSVWMNCSTFYPLAAGNTIKMWLFHRNSGSSLNFYNPALYCYRVR